MGVTNHLLTGMILQVGCPWKLVTIVSKLVYNLFMGLSTYIYRCYNPCTKYHGHPSSNVVFEKNQQTAKLQTVNGQWDQWEGKKRLNPVLIKEDQ